MPADIIIHPVTSDRWDDLARLFGPSGAYSGCWCMWWRQSAAQYDRDHGEPNRRAMQGLVEEGRVPGLLAYLDGEPAGWCSLAPREQFGRLVRSPVLKPIDKQPVWSIVCFFIDGDTRGRGVATALLRAAIDYAVSQGAAIVEGYASDPARTPGDASLFTGTISMFEKAGFAQVAHYRPSARRTMRWTAG